MAQTYGILVDYEYCFGCYACEIACQNEKQLPRDQFGVKVCQVGPWEIEGDNWQDAYMPAFTKQCDLCAERVGKGRLPSCVKHCEARCLKFGELDDLLDDLKKKPQQMIVAP